MKFIIPLRWIFPFPRRLLTSLTLLRIIWIFLFFILEHKIYQRAIESCSWPLDGPRECRLAIITDPHLVDKNSHSRRGIPLWLSKVFTDRYMRRNWEYLMRQKPGTVLFLGDLLDRGNELDNERWFAEYERFWKVFPPVEGVNVVTSIPGNHDVGLGNGIYFDRLNRFKSHFGGNSTSRIVTVCNFQLVLLDTLSLLNTANPEVYEPAFLFLDSISNIPQPYGRILFSHIPLYRPPDTHCGSLRESSQPIPMGAAYQYPNTLDAELSTRILDTIWPVAAIFSGHDHDYCIIEHRLEGRREHVAECTVKSFSGAAGVKYPGYQLLSFRLPPINREPVKKGRPNSKTSAAKTTRAEGTALETKLCLLPSPINGYLIYTIMVVISCIWIIGTHSSCWRRLKKPAYIEMHNVPKEEEDSGDQPLIGWRANVDGIIRDCVSLFIFIFIGFVLQIIGVY